MKVCCTCKIEKSLSEFHKNQKRCKSCRKEKNKVFYLKNKTRISKRNSNYENNHPWIRTLITIRQRCNNPNNSRYYCYGKRGIKCLINAKEIEEIWFRDNAYLMERPNIDRKDNDGDYTFNNCRFMDQSAHAKKTYKERKINNKGRFIKCHIKK